MIASACKTAPHRRIPSHCEFATHTLLMEQNDEYAIQKRYISLGSLAQLSENPAIRLPAAPALA